MAPIRVVMGGGGGHFAALVPSTETSMFPAQYRFD